MVWRPGPTPPAYPQTRGRLLHPIGASTNGSVGTTSATAVVAVVGACKRMLARLNALGNIGVSTIHDTFIGRGRNWVKRHIFVSKCKFEIFFVLPKTLRTHSKRQRLGSVHLLASASRQRAACIQSNGAVTTEFALRYDYQVPSYFFVWVVSCRIISRTFF